MIEKKGNLWKIDAQYRVITTNGYVKKDGTAVMGRGCAKEAAQKYPDLSGWLGRAIMNRGNIPHLFPHGIITFPVKYNWWEKADLELIKRSTIDLVTLATGIEAESLVMPRPGCGNGQLQWRDVRPILKYNLDDRFTVVSFDWEE